MLQRDSTSSRVTLKVLDSKVNLTSQQAELVKYLQRTIERQHFEKLQKAKEEKANKYLVKINIKKRPLQWESWMRRQQMSPQLVSPSKLKIKGDSKEITEIVSQQSPPHEHKKIERLVERPVQRIAQLISQEPSVVISKIKHPRNSNGKLVNVTVATSPLKIINSSPDHSPAVF